jgi:hypothetical protein
MGKRIEFERFLFLGLGCLLFAACPEPGPLYGTWADNKGNTVSFFDDNTFSAKIVGSAGSVDYKGSYTLLLNSLTIDCTEMGLRIVTEWDIRGNILYIGWTTVDGEPLSLTLFKISN